MTEKKSRTGGDKDPMRGLIEGRSDLFSFDPNKFHVIKDKRHPLYDERAFNPPNEAMVLNIIANGVLEPVLFRTEEVDGELVPVLIDGRQRVINCIEANKRLLAKGELIKLVPAVRKRCDDHTAIGLMVTTNEVRVNDENLVKAAKARRMIDEYAYTLEKCALQFGVSVATLKRFMLIDEATSEVKDAYRVGELPAGAAVELAKLPPGKQREAVASLRNQGKVNGEKKHQGANDAAKQAARAAGAPAVKERQHLRSIKAVKALLGELKESEPHVKDRAHHEALVTVLEWAMGGDAGALRGMLEGMQYNLPKGCEDKD